MHYLIWEDLLTTKDIESISGLIVHFYKLFYFATVFELYFRIVFPEINYLLFIFGSRHQLRTTSS